MSWEINRNRKEGIEIVVVEDLAGYEDRLYRLLCLNAAKYNMKGMSFDSSFFHALRENMPEETRVYAAFKKGELVGMCLVLGKGGIWHAMLVGIDHNLTGNDLTYYNLCYYQPIKDAIESRCKRIYYGNSLYELKIRRGCRLMQVDAYYKPHGRVSRMCAKPFFFIHRAWNGSKLPSVVRRELGTHERTQTPRDRGPGTRIGNEIAA
jgi:predicted N-acyltransferase